MNVPPTRVNYEEQEDTRIGRRGQGRAKKVPMHEEQHVQASLSADIILYLRHLGMTLREVGDLIGLSESFMSRVANKKRSLTVEHLEGIAQAVDMPLPLLLSRAMSKQSVPKHLVPMHRKVQAVLSSGVQLEPVLRKNRRLGLKSARAKTAFREKRSKKRTK